MEYTNKNITNNSTINNNVMEIHNLSKEYYEFADFKLEDINIDLPRGCIMGFIGKNGAGKTTTIKLMLNLLKKKSGSIEIFGLDSVKDEIIIKDNIGVVFAENHFPEDFTPTMIGNIMKHVYSKWDSEQYASYLMRFEVDSEMKIKKLSHGMKMKISLAVALSHDAKLLILDEATSGLDPMARSDIMNILYDFTGNDENSVFFSTHITSDLDRIADYLTFIDNGQIKLQVSKEELDENYGIIKCKRDDVQKIPKDIIFGRRDTDFSTEILVNDRKHVNRDYPEFVIDKILIEDLMTYFDAGDKMEERK